jgi:hypothetical protein
MREGLKHPPLLDVGRFLGWLGNALPFGFGGIVAFFSVVLHGLRLAWKGQPRAWGLLTADQIY